MLHRTKTEKATEFYIYFKHAGTLLTHQQLKEMKDFPKLERFEFKTTEKSDLVFAGLGWVTVKANSVVAGWALEGVAVILRRAMV